MSPDLILGPALAEAVRQVVREELAAVRSAQAPVAPASGWMTPPAAWKATGVPVKAIRELIRRGLITARLKNVGRDPKQRKYLVNVDEVKAMVEKRAHDAISQAVSEVEGIVNLEERARRIRARAEGGSNG